MLGSCREETSRKDYKLPVDTLPSIMSDKLSFDPSKVCLLESAGTRGAPLLVHTCHLFGNSCRKF